MNAKGILKGVLLVMQFVIFAGTAGKAQSDQIYDLPTIIPPSPNAASLGKYGDIPVGLYTGVPSISVPLYNLQLGAFTLPIALNYHSGGLKVEEQASWIGLGWSLDAGGVITRAIHNKPDESGQGYWVISQKADTDLIDTYPYITSPLWIGGYDTEPDIFYFNFCGRSGKFVLDTTANHNVFPMPYVNLKFSHDHDLTNFTIQDENGITYVFDLEETTALETSNYTSAWYLTKIITPAGTVSLIYSSTLEFSSNTLNSQVDYIKSAGNTYSDKPSQTQGTTTEVTAKVLQEIDAPNQSIQFYVSRNRTDIPTNSILDSLTVKDMNGAVKKRFSLSHSYFGNTNSSRWQDVRLKLDTVTESSYLDQQIKRHAFAYYSPASVPGIDSKSEDLWGYYNGKANSTLLPALDPKVYPQLGAAVPGADRSADFNSALTGALKSITYPTGGTSLFVYENNDYGFVSSIPVSDTELIARDTQAYARIIPGNSNNVTNDTKTFTIDKQQNIEVAIYGNWTGPVPVDNGPTVTLNKINEDNSRTAIIQHYTVNYSSTLYTVLDPGNYEVIASVDGSGQTASIAVYYTSKGDPIKKKPCGGIRIRQIINTDSITGGSNRKNYLYVTKEDSTRSSGNISTEYNCIEVTPYGYLVRTSTPSTYFGTTQGGVVGYSMVTEFESSDNTMPLGKKESYFSMRPPLQYATTYRLQGDTANPYFVTAGFSIKQATDCDYFRGLLTKENVYNANSTLLSQTLHNYTLDSSLVPGSPHYLELEVRRGMIFTLCYTGCGNCMDPSGVCYYHSQYFMRLNKSKEIASWMYKSNDITTLYDQNGLNPMTDTTTYFYDNPAHALVTRTVSTNSKGAVLKTINMYPGDKAQITGLDGTSAATLDSMVARNMIAPLVQQEKYNNDVLLTRSRKNFKVWPSIRQNIAPASIWYQIATNPMENRLNFISYDSNNNIIQVAKKDDESICYIYDYRTLSPIAMTSNADSASVAYTSFEADGSGNWSVGSGTLSTSGGLTGSNYYTLASGATITKSGLNSSRNYVVTYWSKNGALTISGTSAASGLVKNGWTFYQHNLPAGSTAVTISGSGKALDELRLHPIDAQMTTYTYTPLVGMTSVCTPNNLVSYYEYDGLGRLLRTRDIDGNIIKQYDYQYQVPVTN